MRKRGKTQASMESVLSSRLKANGASCSPTRAPGWGPVIDNMKIMNSLKWLLNHVYHAMRGPYHLRLSTLADFAFDFTTKGIERFPC